MALCWVNELEAASLLRPNPGKAMAQFKAAVRGGVVSTISRRSAVRFAESTGTSYRGVSSWSYTA